MRDVLMVIAAFMGAGLGTFAACIFWLSGQQSRDEERHHAR